MGTRQKKQKKQKKISKNMLTGSGRLLAGGAGKAVRMSADAPGSVRMLHFTSVNQNRQANTKKHRVADWQRFQIMELAKPVLPELGPEDTSELWRHCPKEIDDRKDFDFNFKSNPLEKIYAEELRQHLDESPMIAVFQGNSMNHFNARRNFQNARRCNFEYKYYSKKTTFDVLIGSRWENLTHFTRATAQKNGNCHFAFSRQLDNLRNPLPDEIRLEPRAKDLLSFIKKSLDLVFLCVVVHGRIIDKSQLTKLADMPGIDSLHSELSAILQTPTRRTSQLLGSNQQKLSIQLDQYVK